MASQTRNDKKKTDSQNSFPIPSSTICFNHLSPSSPSPSPPTRQNLQIETPSLPDSDLLSLHLTPHPCPKHQSSPPLVYYPYLTYRLYLSSKNRKEKRKKKPFIYTCPHPPLFLNRSCSASSIPSPPHPTSSSPIITPTLPLIA